MTSVERRTGVALLIVAIGAAWLARGYRVAFIADPVGPRAFPLLAAALIGIGAAFMIARPSVAPWPARPEQLRLAAAAATIAVYGAALPWLGFITATAALMWTLALLFGGRGARAAIAAIGIALAMYALFVHALDVPLPIGRVFLATR